MRSAVTYTCLEVNLCFALSVQVMAYKKKKPSPTQIRGDKRDKRDKGFLGCVN